MPRFWQISPTLWINPVYIVYVEDLPDIGTGILWVTMVAVTSGLNNDLDRSKLYTLELERDERERFLAYLAQETESPLPPASA